MSAPRPPPHVQRRLFGPEKAAWLDGRLRRFLYRPDRLAERFVQPGSRVLDFGCGPGFFTRAFAQRAGETGRVWSVDLQGEMLEILQDKLAPEGLMSRITTHRCRPDAISLRAELNGTFDCAFAIFVVHEVPDPEKLFQEIALLLKPGGRFFFSEPPLEVSGTEFTAKLALIQECGFRPDRQSWYFLNRAAEFTKR